jgi:hypothetical protein
LEKGKTMKKKPIIIAAVLLIILIGGYTIQRRNEDGGPELNLSSTQREEVLARVKAEEHQPQIFPFDKRAEFIDTMKVELVDIQKELDLFTAKIDKSETTATVRGDRKATLASMQDKLARTIEQLDKVKDAGESNWNSTNSVFKKLYFSLKNSVDETRQRLNSNTES